MLIETGVEPCFLSRIMIYMMGDNPE